MQNKTIGILTFWSVPNYGAWAQGYALNATVRTLLNGESQVEHISYLHPTHNDAYYSRDIKLRNAFMYSWNRIPHSTPMVANELENKEYGTIILGSDVIWDFSIPVYGSDSHLVGIGLKAGRFVSYAASAGVMSAPTQIPSWFSEGLRKLDEISVRDDYTADMVNTLIGRRPQVVLDPTLLWDFAHDNLVLDTMYDNYILVYGAEFDENFIELAKKYAQEKKCKLISVGWVHPWCDVNFKMIELRAMEWVGMFKHAEAVIASTFHGLMFGLAFRKQVKLYRTDYMRNRSYTILQRLGLNDYLNNPIDYKRIFDAEMNYQIIDKELEIWRNESIEALRKAIGV